MMNREQLETLECRTLLSSAVLVDGTLQVIGDNGVKNEIVVSKDTARAVVVVSLGVAAPPADPNAVEPVVPTPPTVMEFALADVKRVRIAGGDLDDSLKVDESTEAFAVPLKIYGRAGNDTLVGGTGRDMINGGAGNDSIDGAAGDDHLWGRDGNDSINGGAGNDWIRGERGDDVLSGGEGNDRLWGGFGNDLITGDAGNDRIWTNHGSNNASGGDGDDRIHGKKGDTLDGGAGKNVVLPKPAKGPKVHKTR